MSPCIDVLIIPFAMLTAGNAKEMYMTIDARD